MENVITANELKKEPGKARRLCKRWFIDAFGGMAQGLFATLIAGLIIEQIGKLIGDNLVGNMLRLIGTIAKMLMGAGIGAGVARSLKASPLVIFAAMIAGMLGANAGQFISSSYEIKMELLSANPLVLTLRTGDPIGAYLCALLASEAAILITGKTKIDIVALPLTVFITAIVVALIICPPVILATNALGEFVRIATDFTPFFMGIVIAVIVGLLLTLPTSSAAICIAIGIGGANGHIAAAAAVAGCCCHMIGFAVVSFKTNRWSGLVSQGLGTSMLQIPNVFRKPLILVPMIISSAICGPLATCVFVLYTSSAGAGMGTSGLVGVFETITASAANGVNTWTIVSGVALLCFILPALLSYGVFLLMKKKGWLSDKDYDLKNE